MEMSTLFGGIPEMQNQLVNAIRKKRTKMNISPKQLDEICGFGDSSVFCDRKTVTTEEFEADPTKMTSDIFSAASFALDLNIDKVLAPPKGESLELVVKQMESEQSGLVASAGGLTKQSVNCRTQAPVYAILKALSEMDEVVAGHQWILPNKV